MSRRARHMLTALLTIGIATSPLSAQTTPGEAISFIEGIVEEACGVGRREFMGVSVDDVLERVTGRNAQSILYICDYKNVLRQAESATNDILGTLERAGQTMGGNLLQRALGTLGTNTDEDPGHADVAAQRTVEQALADAQDPESDATIEDYRETLIREIQLAEERALEEVREVVRNPDRFPEGSRERIVADHLAINPAALEAELNRIRMTSMTAQQAAATEVTAEASSVAAEAFLNNTSYQETVIRTLDPETGTAASLDSGAQSATSTREAVNELSRGWANYMRQDATLTSSVVEGLKSVVTQQTLTNQALKTEADRLFQARYDAIEAQARQQEMDILIITEDIERAFSGLSDSIVTYSSFFSSPSDESEE